MMGTILAKAWGWVFGGGGSGLVQTVGNVITAKTQATEQADTNATDDTESARQFSAPTNQPGAINQFVDAYNRLVRPVIATWLLGIFAGWWPQPDLSKIDPQIIAAAGIVLTFWFGGRALLKDLPQGIIAVLQNLRK